MDTTNAQQNSDAATASRGPKPPRAIKFGVDGHWKECVVVRQIDGTAPQPPQRFTPEGFMAWAAKQVKLADDPITVVKPE